MVQTCIPSAACCKGVELETHKATQSRCYDAWQDSIIYASLKKTAALRTERM